MGADGTFWESLSCQAYGSRNPARKPLADPDKVYMQIKGREVYQQAVRRIVDAVTDCLNHCHLTLDDVAMVISHQMNARIIESAAKRLNLPDEKVFVNIQNYGNTSAASVPIAFDECVRQGKVKKGDIVIFVAFGAGVTWGANVIEICRRVARRMDASGSGIEFKDTNDENRLSIPGTGRPDRGHGSRRRARHSPRRPRCSRRPTRSSDSTCGRSVSRGRPSGSTARRCRSRRSS